MENTAVPAILIVDDNPNNLNLLFDLLDEAGFEVLVSQNGESALKRAEGAQPDIILLDVMMPGMDGFETCRRLKALKATQHIPVIFMTALAGTDSKIKGFELGAVDYITKPIQAPEVLARVRTHLTILSLQKDLQVKNEMLSTMLEKEKELNALKSQFVSMVSHEFKTPLTTIALSSDLLKRYDDRMSTQERREELSVIEKTIEHMSELLDNVLTVSRWEAGKIKFEPEAIELQPFCQRLAARYQALCESTHTIEFAVKTTHDTLTIDPTLFEYILSNLLSNAIKYSPDGGRVSFGIDEQGEAVSFRISDQGLGIPHADRQNLFESFHRGENVGNIKGTGLGLSIVKKLVELHHGTIEVKSQLNHGSTFIITIPRKNI